MKGIPEPFKIVNDISTFHTYDSVYYPGNQMTPIYARYPMKAYFNPLHCIPITG